MKLIESPINYMGSKYKLLDRLIPLFPKADTFVDLFAVVWRYVSKNSKKKTNTEYYFTNVF